MFVKSAFLSVKLGKGRKKVWQTIGKGRERCWRLPFRATSGEKRERPVILIDGGRDAWVYLWVKIAFMSVKLGKKRKVTIRKGQER